MTAIAVCEAEAVSGIDTFFAGSYPTSGAQNRTVCRRPTAVVPDTRCPAKKWTGSRTRAVPARQRRRQSCQSARWQLASHAKWKLETGWPILTDDAEGLRAAIVTFERNCVTEGDHFV